MQFKRYSCCSLLALALASPVSAYAADDAAQRYARLMSEAEAITVHNELLQKQLESQKSEELTIQAQIERLDGVAAELPAMLDRMHSSLKSFVAKDLPFQDTVSDRQARMAKLDELMTDASVSHAERYRRLLEAYQIELDYGRTLETYKGTLSDGREVDFIRVGRVTLLYRTEDGSEVAYWSKADNQWVVDSSLRSAITQAFRVAKKELAPDLIRVPVPAPEEVRS
ncbi:MAG: DUF3450 domain-containing protein [Porticoccaceae bacterium]